MSITLLRAASRAPRAGRNGGGVTFEVALAAAAADSSREYLWRVSIANVDRAGPFSSFTGLERVIAVIDGAGMTLRGLAQGDVVLHPFQACRFDGGVPVEGLLPRGPVKDLNVIYDPRRCRARLTIVAGVLPERVAACADLLVINLGDERIDVDCDGRSSALGRHDALWIRSPRASVGCPRLERSALIEIEHPLGARESEIG
jgi:environmental stress-induced protein Ves